MKLAPPKLVTDGDGVLAVPPLDRVVLNPGKFKSFLDAFADVTPSAVDLPLAGPGEESQRARLRRESHRDLASIVGKILGKGPIELAGNGSYSLIENARGEFGFSVVFHSDESYFGYLWFTDEAPHQVVEATGFPNDALNQQVLELTRSKAAIFAARNDDPDSSKVTVWLNS